MRKSRLNRFVTTNPWLKLTSLVLASMLWFFVVSKGRSVIVVDTAIEFKNIPEKLKVINNRQRAAVSIEGYERLLQKLRQEDINVVIDLAEVKEGDVVLPLSSDNVTLPKALTVNDISPQTIKLKIEAKEKKTVPVRTVIVGSPASGFRVEKIEAVPDSIQIEGPRSVIEKIYSIKTEPVDITGVTGSFKYNAYLDVGEKNIKTEPTEVSVSVATKKTQQK